jgi:hypothetical protein
MLTGQIPVGTIVYLQDGVRPFGVSRHWQPIFRNPWQVLAWHNRAYHPGSSKRPATTFLRGGHLATVRSLRDGTVCQVADWLLQECLDL